MGSIIAENALLQSCDETGIGLHELTHVNLAVFMSALTPRLSLFLGSETARLVHEDVRALRPQ